MIKLREFIDLCNLEGTYSLINRLERENDHENCSKIILCSSPKISFDLRRIEEYLDYEVTDVNLDIENKSILISIKQCLKS